MITATKISPSEETDAKTKVLVQQFEALADPVRLRLLEMLWEADGTLTVGELTEKLDLLSQPTVSHHLRYLREAGFIEKSRGGLYTFYLVNVEALAALGTFLNGFAHSRP